MRYRRFLYFDVAFVFVIIIQYSLALEVEVNDVKFVLKKTESSRNMNVLMQTLYIFSTLEAN